MPTRLFPIDLRPQTAIYKPSRRGGLVIPNRQPVAAILAPVWGPISNQSDQENVFLFRDFSVFISDGTPPFTFEDIGGLLPTGLVLDTDAGTVNGTPTVVAAPVLVSFRMTNAAGNDVGSFTWEITV